ncbi:hypothetical protein [Pseudoalteromonas luteoviolacea]|uniref:Uncharacterized protein n=1 Tax=Pseudoalteromonas luteoviolacea H33 TaxID=1365251 RepID=A0A167DH37_9GAMM|nr:hypothetical protein [Pseudoalteromonas luteoviolacea]KZN48835.1 hypothetical protein N476_20925 [Pseudoalteromonas luteoviolacea H33]KZN72850.1 hypothetical protein N477_24140 [Pseudoalteromonas luteoviolacea H33-S]MBQ4880028.1 hypothetical protein [Pseudoalteromonas luteoviolacea]MBQ4909045.1 hypothetical protein [Pseudoalteromonas luteoviolacea]
MYTKSKLAQTVQLKTNDDRVILELSEFELLGSSFKCTVTLSSRGFGFHGAVYFDNPKKFLSDLEIMNSTMIGSAELKEDYNDHFLKFELNHLGHLIVSACFVEYSEHSQNLAVEFKTDQTCLPSFLEDLKLVLV